MKLVYFGYDPLSSCLPIFFEKGYEVAAIYTGQQSAFSKEVQQFAKDKQIQLCFDKPTHEQMQTYVEQGIELFFSAEYPHKIPLPDTLKYSINVHPTLLPEGRGMTPLPYLILQYPQCAGITFHKLHQQFDMGDIVLQQPFNVGPQDTFDTLSAIIYQQTPIMLAKLLTDFKRYYANAKVQNSGSEWPTLGKDNQCLDWQQPTAALLTRIRAFGSLGCYAHINHKQCIVTAATGQLLASAHPSGTLLADTPTKISIATQDGQLDIPKKNLFWQ